MTKTFTKFGRTVSVTLKAKTGGVRSIDRDGDEVVIDLRLISPWCLKIGYPKDEIDKHVGLFHGVESVSVTADEGLEWRPEMNSEEFQEARRERIKESVAEQGP